MTRTIQLAAWLLLAAIIVVTLGPIGMRPSSGANVEVERALAFVGLGFLFALAYPRHVWWTALLVVLCTCGLEVLQNLRPDRHGRELDALVKVMGGIGGMIIGWGTWRLAVLLIPGRRDVPKSRHSAS